MSIPVPPSFDGITPPYVPVYGPMPNITPFTYRDGWTYLQRYEALVKYIQRTLIPWVQENYDGLNDSFTEEVNKLIDYFNTVIGDLDGKSVEEALDELTAWVETVVADATLAQDPTIAALIKDPTKFTGKAIMSPRAGNCHMIVVLGQSNAAMPDLRFKVAEIDTRIVDYRPETGLSLVLENDNTSMAGSFARELVKNIPAGDWICIVNAAVGSTAFTESATTVDGVACTASWDVANTTADVNMATRANTWIAGAKTLIAAGGSTMNPAVILFSGFEGDTLTLDTGTFSSKLVALTNYIRTTALGGTFGPLTPIIVGSLVPEYVHTQASGYPHTLDVANALSLFPSGSISLSAFFYGPEGYAKAGEPIHYGSAGQIRRGKVAYEALGRARTNRAAIIPNNPQFERIVREPGMVTAYWTPIPTRWTSFEIQFSFDGGYLWYPGHINLESRTSATMEVWPWQPAQARIRVTNIGAIADHQVTEWMYSPVSNPTEILPPGVVVQAIKGSTGQAITPVAGLPMTIYGAYTLPAQASLGNITIAARKGDNSSGLFITVNQANGDDLGRSVMAGVSTFALAAAPKAVEGSHISAATLSATGTSLKYYRDREAPVVMTPAAGTVAADVVAIGFANGATVDGYVGFYGIEHNASQIIWYRQVVASRLGIKLP